MNRRSALQLVGGALTLSGCTRVASGGSRGTRQASTIPHVLRYADGSDLVGLNPLVSTHASTAWLAQLWAAWLLRYDEHYEPVPELATTVPTVRNGLVSPDGRRITYRLRDAVWSDGTPFTSRDVAFSVALVLNPATNISSRDGWDKIEHVETPDSHTAIFHMKELYSAFLPTFFSTGGANPCILPEHLVRGQDPNKGPFFEKPVGIGPFVVDSWARSERVVLLLNPRYWKGKPRLQRIEYKIIPSADTMVTQLRTHELDLWVHMNPSYLDEVAAIAGTQVSRRPSPYWRLFACNCEHPSLSDIRVRQALNYGIDRRTIVDKALHGVGTLNWSVVAPDSWAYNDAVHQYPFDLKAAAALLDRAGWHVGPDGRRQKQGVPLHLNFAYQSGDPATAEIAELVRSTWQRLGVTFDSKTYSPSVFAAPYQDGGIAYGGKFDVCALSFGNTPAPSDALEIFTADQIPPNGQNIARYRNGDVSRLVSEASHTLERSKQAGLLRNAQAIVAEQCPVFPIAQNVDLHPHNVDLVHFRPVPSGPFDYMMDVDI